MKSERRPGCWAVVFWGFAAVVERGVNGSVHSSRAYLGRRKQCVWIHYDQVAVIDHQQPTVIVAPSGLHPLPTVASHTDARVGGASGKSGSTRGGGGRGGGGGAVVCVGECVVFPWAVHHVDSVASFTRAIHPGRAHQHQQSAAATPTATAAVASTATATTNVATVAKISTMTVRPIDNHHHGPCRCISAGASLGDGAWFALVTAAHGHRLDLSVR